MSALVCGVICLHAADPASAKVRAHRHSSTKTLAGLRPGRSRPDTAGLSPALPLPPAPSSMAEARQEIAALVGGSSQGLGDINVMEAALRAAGVAIYDANRRFAAASRGARPGMWIQAGAVQGLAELVADPHSRPLSSLLKALVAGEVPQIRRKLTAGSYRLYFDQAINDPTTAADRMWSALVQAVPVPGQDIAAALGGKADAQISALQLQLLLLRLRADALAFAIQAAPRGARAGQRHAVKPRAAAATDSPCEAINDIPESVVAGLNATSEHLVEVFGEAKKVAGAELYGDITGIASFASDVMNYTLMITNVEITTTTHGTLIRTKSASKPGGDVPLRSTFRMLDNPLHSELLDCLGRVMAFLGGTFSTPEADALANDTVSWTVDAGPATIKPAEAKTNHVGEAETTLSGKPQPVDLTSRSAVPVQRTVKLTADIDPESSKPAWDRLGDDALTVLESALGSATGRELAAAGKAFKLAAKAAMDLGLIGLIHGRTEVTIKDWLAAPVLDVDLHYTHDQDLPNAAGEVAGEVVASVQLTPASVQDEPDGLHVVWNGNGTASFVKASGAVDGSTGSVSVWVAQDPGEYAGCFENSCGYPCSTSTALGSPSTTPGTVEVSELEAVYDDTYENATPRINTDGYIDFNGAAITLTGSTTVEPPCTWLDGNGTDPVSETDEIFQTFAVALTPPAGASADGSFVGSVLANDGAELSLGAWKLPWVPTGAQAATATVNSTNDSDPQDVTKYTMTLALAPPS